MTTGHGYSLLIRGVAHLHRHRHRLFILLSSSSSSTSKLSRWALSQFVESCERSSMNIFENLLLPDLEMISFVAFLTQYSCCCCCCCYRCWCFDCCCLVSSLWPTDVTKSTCASFGSPSASTHHLFSLKYPNTLVTAGNFCC